MIRIRRPAVDDKAIIKIIKKQLFPMTQKSFPYLKFNKQEVYERLKKGITYVVSIKGISNKLKTIGFIHVYRSGKAVWVDMIAMNPNHRSKGWGGRLMTKAERVGRRYDCDIIYLYVDECNKKGQKFYHKHGYKEALYEPAMSCYLYSKTL